MRVSIGGADEAKCSLSRAEHEQLLRRYEALIGTLGADKPYPDFDPYSPQAPLAPLRSLPGQLPPQPIGFRPEDEKKPFRSPRSPVFLWHLAPEGYAGPGPRNIHLVNGSKTVYLAPGTLRAFGFVNKSLEHYLLFRFDRFAARKGPMPERVFSKRDAEQQCRSYLSTLLLNDVTELVAVEGPFYDEPKPNYSALEVRCDRTRPCWPQWDVRFWRTANGFTTADHVASCTFDAKLGPTHIWINYDPDKPLPASKSRISKEEATKIVVKVGGEIASRLRFGEPNFNNPALESIRLRYTGRSNEWHDHLIDNGELPGGSRFVKYEGTPLVWQARFQVKARRKELGVYDMWIDIDAGTGQLLSANSKRRSAKN
ncbi:MAG: hypothetical protein HYZ28_02860 [Myxococcales bacterium]|nr:hypothetical protein [Myxococcales bacterium]